METRNDDAPFTLVFFIKINFLDLFTQSKINASIPGLLSLLRNPEPSPALFVITQSCPRK